MKTASLVFTLSAFVAVGARAACPAFSAPINYSAQRTPRSVTVADLNADGRLDLVVPNQNSDSVSVLLAKPDGTFADAVNYAEAGTSPLSVAVGDVNGDGRPDLVIANCTSKNLSFRFGSSQNNGTFSAPAHVAPLGDCVFPIKLADLNGDGKLDIVAIAGNDVDVFIGNGFGVFGVPAKYTAGNSPSAIAVADFNGDGKNDLAIGNGSGTDVSLFLNVGNGTFTPATSVPTNGHEVRSVIAADFNGDGKIDLAAGNGASNTVAVLLGNGNGTFQTAVTYNISGSPWSLGAADFNGDGRLDLIAVGLFNNVMLLLGNGDGTFQPHADFNGGESPRDLAVADVDHDGRPDVIVANGDVGNPTSAKNYVSVLLNKCTSPPRRRAVKH